jgi:hypothetical protein
MSIGSRRRIRDWHFCFLRALLVLLLGVFFSANAAAQTHAEGLEAFNRADYVEAASIWLTLAKKGDAPSRYSLGRMYDTGVGVRQDYAKAAYWYALAAEQNYPYAQGNLAVLYAMGRGVEQDFVLSYMWSSLAAVGYSKWAGELREAALRNRDIVFARMTDAQKLAALEKVRQWRANNGAQR